MVIPERRQSLIDAFVELNAQINLSAIREPGQIYVKHILDALELNKLITFDPSRLVADVGTGSGFPLLPLAKSHPDVQFI